ncbi:MAG TPA: hypothetical protein PKG48_08270, partial [Bacteroidales bacterium]|nr:hypothetical protein [Bacteroidales bacterium]
VEVVKVFAEKFNIPGMEEMTAAGPAYFFVSGLFYLGSLTGAWMMFRLRKTGFHVYTVFQILLILAPMYFLHLPSPGFVEIFFSGLFVLLYSRHLKIMA